MDKTIASSCREDEAHCQRCRAERAEEKVEELEGLLAEATTLLFVRGDKPSKELFGWWFRRDYTARQNAKRVA